MDGCVGHTAWAPEGSQGQSHRRFSLKAFCAIFSFGPSLLRFSLTQRSLRSRTPRTPPKTPPRPLSRSLKSPLMSSLIFSCTDSVVGGWVKTCWSLAEGKMRLLGKWKRIRCWLHVQRCELLNGRVGASLVMPMLGPYNEVNQVKARDWGENSAQLFCIASYIYSPVVTFLVTLCQDQSNMTTISFTKGRKGMHNWTTEVVTKSGQLDEKEDKRKGFFRVFCSQLCAGLWGSLGTNWGSTWEQPQPLSLLLSIPVQPIHTNHAAQVHSHVHVAQVHAAQVHPSQTHSYQPHCQGTARWQFRNMNLPIKCFQPTHKDAQRGFDHLTLQTPWISVILSHFE